MINPQALAEATEAKRLIDAVLARVPEDADPPPPNPKITLHGGSAVEGQPVVCRITSDIPFRHGDVIYVSTLFGKAGATDLTPFDRLPVAPMPGTTEAVFSVQTTDDALDEDDETAGIRIVDVLRDDQGNALLDIAVAEATITILDNDDAQPPPAGTVPKFFSNAAAIQPPLADGLFVYPVAKAHMDGSYTLYVRVVGKNGYDEPGKFTAPITFRYILDKVRLEKRTADPAVYVQTPEGRLYAALAISRPVDGVHAATLRLTNAASNVRARSADFSVGTAPASLPAYMIPVHGQSSNSENWGRAVYDEILWPGGNTRPQPVGKPRAVSMPIGITEAGLDPDSMLGIGAYFMEPWTMFGSGLYHLETDYRRNSAGWVIARGFVWQAGTHNATAATPTQRRKPEYNGPRLANLIDGYSTGRFGDKVLWNISLRGTLSRVSLLDGSKEAVAGRVYRENTVALDHYDDSIKQSEIDAANYELVGDALDPEHLEWEAPHDVYPCPWNPDNESILLDSFKHRVIHVDASVSPARVRVLVGVSGVPGRQAGLSGDARINRPYACIVYPDRRVVFCCTPKAGLEADSAVFELSSDWQTVREIAGPDKVFRPFWMCATDDPDFAIIWEHATGKFKRVNLVTGDIEPWGWQWVTTKVVKHENGQPVYDDKGVFVYENVTKLEAFTYARPDGWGQVVCDVNGTIGPKGDWFFLTSQSSANTDIWRFDKDGIRRPGNFLKQSIGVAPQGAADKYFEPMGHYVWWLDIHSKYALGAVQGFGNTSPNFFRRRLPTDPVLTYDHVLYRTGEGMWDNGTLPGFPCDLRPSGRGLRSAAGHSLLGNLPSLQHLLGTMTDAEFLQYARDGFGGPHKRPEFAGEWARLLAYWARWHDDDPPSGLRPPSIPKRPVPQVLTWGVSRDDDGVTVTLTTDKPTWGCLSDGHGSTPADAYKTAHTFRLEDCGATLTVRLADLDGNIIQASV